MYRRTTALGIAAAVTLGTACSREKPPATPPDEPKVFEGFPGEDAMKAREAEPSPSSSGGGPRVRCLLEADSDNCKYTGQPEELATGANERRSE